MQQVPGLRASSTNATGSQLSGNIIRITTCGTLQVVRDGHVVTESDWHTRQARQLLKILITERPRPVSSDRLIEILWPHSTPSAAATTLRSAINALRNVLEPGRPNRAPSRYIITQTPGYAFHLHPDIWLDVDVFERELNRLPHIDDPYRREEILERVIGLYQDDYLISDPYADWVQSERERLQERYFNALLQLADARAQHGDFAAAMSACRRILARDEVREHAYQALMRYQAESGDSAAALITYERCRTILAEELGADPSPLTQMLHRSILNGEIQPAPVNRLLASARHEGVSILSQDGHGVAGELRLGVLPQRALLPLLDEHFPTMFVGRQSESDLLTARLQAALAGHGDCVLLEGEAGVGKTRLAYHVLQQAMDADASVISATSQALEQQLPFAPLADGISRYLAQLPDEWLHHLPPASLGQLVTVIPSLEDRLPGLATPAGEVALGAEDNRQRLIDGIVALLAALAQQRPLVLFMDDLQWADHDTLAVVGRLAQRVSALPLLVLAAYRSDDLAENQSLVTLVHSFRRSRQDGVLAVARLSLPHVEELVGHHTGWQEGDSRTLAAALYAATQGNALFVTEALRNLQEQGSQSALLEQLRTAEPHDAAHGGNPFWHTRRVHEVITERLERLPGPAREVLQLAAVIGRDFSLELLENASAGDPIAGLETLLERRFLVERLDERLDFSHQVVRQVAFEGISTLQRRRLHRRVADALVRLGRAASNPGEAAFHYGQAGQDAHALFTRYSVLAGEQLLRAYGFRQAIAHFTRALDVLATLPVPERELERRALQGCGLAHEGRLDPNGVTQTYRRLQVWAAEQGDRDLLLTTYSRHAAILGLLGQQRESNQLLHELMEALQASDAGARRSRVIADLIERRRVIYGPDEGEGDDRWSPYIEPPPVVADPVGDILQTLEPVHAVLPLLDYGWTLLVQGQLGEATRCLEAVVDLATETAQPSIASTAYHQLATTARILGDMEQSQRLNDESIAINRQVSGTTSELASMWPRIASAFLSLHTGHLDDAERKLRRVVDFLAARPGFNNYRNSAHIGLGLVELARGNRVDAKQRLQDALADPIHLYPYTHVAALVGLARIAHGEARTQECKSLMRQALHFAGQRSLLEEYVETVMEMARLCLEGVPVRKLLRDTHRYVRAAGLGAPAAQLAVMLESLPTRAAPAATA